MTLDYFYGQSGELFAYFRIPKALFQDSRFRQLSTDARTLYGILLDRMSLSVKNNWLDEQGRVYIIYTVREVQESLCCAEHKAVKLFRELEQTDLIERKRRGLGRPSLIYVKNFSSGLPKAQVRNCANSNSCAAENAVQVQPKAQSNKTEKNKTERNNPFFPDETDRLTQREQLEDYFYQALEVELLLRLCPDDEDLAVSVDQKQLLDILLNVGIVRPVFIWGAPGIGKSAIVEQFAADMGLPCVSLLGSQLAPEDIIGVPQIVNGRSVFCPPKMIAQEEPYCLFLDELNACSQEVQKAFYSLILERRIGEYHLPKGSIVIGAGNRAQDNAITRPMSSALLNRMFHVELRADSRIWLEWAAGHGIHPYVYDYICFRPDQLWSPPSKTEEPFSSPRSWHMLSDAIISYGDSISEQELAVLANGCLTAAHAAQFVAYVRQVRQAYSITKIINGTQNWPDKPEERDVLYFLAQSFRAQLLKELPRNRSKLTSATQTLTLRAKELLVELAGISLEIAQVAITPEDGETLPAWFIVEVTRDLPALTKKKMG